MSPSAELRQRRRRWLERAAARATAPKTRHGHSTATRSRPGFDEGRLPGALRHLGCVEVVGQALELALPRVARGEEARRALAPASHGEPRLGGEHLVDGASVAAERDELDALALRLEHLERGLRGGLDQLTRLLLPPPPEAVRRRAALLVPSLDEARPDLRRDQPLALEDADRVAAEPDEQRRDEWSASSASSSGPSSTRSYAPSCASPNGGRTTIVSSAVSIRTAPSA